MPEFEPGARAAADSAAPGNASVVTACVSGAISGKRTADAMERCATALESIAQVLTPVGAAALFEGLAPLVADIREDI